ncbi:MAG TPA: adenylate/guanylate cyclase domain-containing protein [Bradyrhizobium sp.]|jgi:adenylate cyclase|nr:adenylate/guanylate cyclase domain-containing protein [Bradyrhizobium sp.]
MQCVRCGGQNKASNDYCEGCGAPLGIKCDACNHVNGPTSRFCGQCSAALAPSSAGPDPSSQRMLRSLSSKGGERKRLTLLFADIRNSTSLIDSLGDPELGMRRLEPVLALMKDAVHRYDGIVNKIQGDGVMAIFGAPRPHEDHAVRGCLAALAMQDAIARLDASMQIRVGLHTGEVVVQTVENSIYQTYDAAGANVHLASRMEQMANEGCILITGDTYAAAKQFVEVAPLGMQTVRGIAAPVDIFKLTGLLNAPASGVFRSGRRLTSLIGRSDQFAALELELANTVKGEGRVVGVVGEAGIGKSRLCFEFSDNCRRQGIRVFEGRVLAHGRATPFQPVLELLRDYFGIRVKESIEVSRSRVIERFATLSSSEQVLLLLLEFLGLAEPAYAVPKLDPRTRKIQLLDFVRTLARSGPRDTATVVLIEDLHWIDAASEEFIEALADAVVGTTTLLIVNFRPGFAASFMQRSHYRQIGMPPLASEQAQLLLLEHFGEDPSLALLSRNIIERAQGNPFFLEELVNAIAERGDFEGERGAYRLKGGIDTIPLPTTVQAVVAARIDHLEEVAKQVLETASVIGRVVSLPILQRVAALPHDELTEAIWHLRQAELLYDLPPYDQGLHAFRHPLIQEVAYRSLLHERRRDLHGLVARAMETLFKDQADEQAGLLAYHLEQAGQTIKAAQQNVRAAIWVGANDPAQALRSWKKVRELLVDQAASPTTNYLRMMACGQIVNFAWREGIAADDAKVFFEEASQLAVSLSDMRAHALISAAYGRILANGGSADEYVERTREAMALAEGGTDASVQITLKAILCHALRTSGRMSEALQMNTEAMDRAHEIVKFDRQTLGFDIEVWLTAMRGQTLAILGRYDEARPFLDRVLRLEEGHVDAIHHVIPSLAYVDIAWAEADPVLAQTHADRAFSLAVKSGNPYLRVYAQACRGLAHTVAGQLGSAIDDLSSALRFARSRKAGLENEARILADMANAYRLNGDVAAALTTVDEAITIAAARHARFPECLARIVRADILSESKAGDQRAAASDERNRAEALMRETGALIFEKFIKGAPTDAKTAMPRQIPPIAG